MKLTERIEVKRYYTNGDGTRIRYVLGRHHGAYTGDLVYLQFRKVKAGWTTEQLNGTLKRCQDGGFAKAVAAETKAPPAIVMQTVEYLLVEWAREIATLLQPR